MRDAAARRSATAQHEQANNDSCKLIQQTEPSQPFSASRLAFPSRTCRHMQSKRADTQRLWGRPACHEKRGDYDAGVCLLDMQPCEPRTFSVTTAIHLWWTARRICACRILNCDSFHPKRPVSETPHHDDLAGYSKHRPR